MLRISQVLGAALMMAGALVSTGAQAATVGLICDGSVQLVVAPTDEKANSCVAVLEGSCTEGFRIDSGYFALAASADGMANGTSAGAADEAGAAQTAISTCETQGSGECAITLAGNDDGETFHSCE